MNIIEMLREGENLMIRLDNEKDYLFKIDTFNIQMLKDAIAKDIEIATKEDGRDTTLEMLKSEYNNIEVKI